MNRFVLDCSVAVAWCFEDQADPYAWRVLALLPRAVAVVPAFWRLEIANALIVGERRKLIRESDTVSFLSMLGGFQFSLDEESSHNAWGSTISLARDQRLSAYDAAYLELSVRKGLPLASRDEALKRAAKALGVEIV